MPASTNALLVASTVPGNPTGRVKSSMTIDSNPNLAAAMAEKPTQKSKASPVKKRRCRLRSRRYPARPVGVVPSFSVKAE